MWEIKFISQFKEILTPNACEYLFFPLKFVHIKNCTISLLAPLKKSQQKNA